MSPYKLAQNQRNAIADLLVDEVGMPVEADLSGVANFQNFLKSHPNYDVGNAGTKPGRFFHLFGPSERVDILNMPPDVLQFHKNRSLQEPGILPDKMYEFGPDRPRRGYSPWVRRQFG